MARYAKQSPEARLAGGIIACIGVIVRGLGRLIGGLGRTGKRRTGRIVIDRQLVRQRWQETQALVQAGGASRLRSAIVEADKLLDYALKGKGLSGETMADRLKSGRHLFSYQGYEAAWQAHKLRNRLVHELEADVLHWEVQKGLANFELALRELGVI